MRDWQIDNYFKQTPCLCGSTNTWHFPCFAGKSQEQVNADYDRVYARLRRQLAKIRKAARKQCLPQRHT